MGGRAQVRRAGRGARLTDPILEHVSNLHPFPPDADTVLSDIVLPDLASLAALGLDGRVDVLVAVEGRDDGLGRVLACVPCSSRVRPEIDDDGRYCRAECVEESQQGCGLIQEGRGARRTFVWRQGRDGRGLGISIQVGWRQHPSSEQAD